VYKYDITCYDYGMTKSTLTARTCRLSIFMFIAGLAIGATANYIAMTSKLPVVSESPTSAEQATLQTTARQLISKELAAPRTVAFTNTRTQYEAPFYVIQEDITEKLRTGSTFKSSYTAAFIKDEKSWAPIYVNQLLK